MGIAWQQQLKQNLAVSEKIAQNIAQSDAQQQQQNVSSFVVALGLLGLIAIAIAAPELLPFLAVDTSETATAAELAGEGAATAAEEPGYITWAKSVVADPSGYSEDSLNKAEEILYRNKML